MISKRDRISFDAHLAELRAEGDEARVEALLRVGKKLGYVQEPDERGSLNEHIRQAARGTFLRQRGTP